MRCCFLDFFYQSKKIIRILLLDILLYPNRFLLTNNVSIPINKIKLHYIWKCFVRRSQLVVNLCKSWYIIIQFWTFYLLLEYGIWWRFVLTTKGMFYCKTCIIKQYLKRLSLSRDNLWLHNELARNAVLLSLFVTWQSFVFFFNLFL